MSNFNLELESNYRIKSGFFQSIGGYYALIVAMVVGILLTPKFIGSIGEDLYSQYAIWQVNGAFLYSFFPASGRLVLVEKVEKSKALGFILFGILIAIAFTLVSILIFDTPIKSIFYLILVIQIIVYLSDQLRSWLQNISEGKNIARSVILTRTIHLVLLLILYPDYTLNNFLFSLVAAEFLGLTYIISLIYFKKIIPIFTSIKITDFIPYYFESNANKALVESFLKSQGIYVSEIKFGSLSLLYRLNETASRTINIPINSLTSYFINLNKFHNNKFALAMWITLAFGLSSFLIIFYFQNIVLEYFNLSETIGIELVVLLVGGVTMSLLRPIIFLKMIQIGQRSIGLYFSFIELLLFWIIAPFYSSSVILAPTILYGVIFILALFHKKFRTIGFFLIPVLCFQIFLLFLATQRQVIPV